MKTVRPNTELEGLIAEQSALLQALLTEVRMIKELLTEPVKNTVLVWPVTDA